MRSELQSNYVVPSISEDLCGIFVKSVIDGSMADRSGCIMINDQIVEVDGRHLSGVSNQEAVEILKRTGNLVKLSIVRYLRGLKFEELRAGISAANVATPTAPYPPTLGSAGMMAAAPGGNSNTDEDYDEAVPSLTDEGEVRHFKS
jgi:C-terminal processing protease CtpA/Prc